MPDILFMAEGGGQSQQLGRMNSHPQTPLQQLNQPPLSSRPTSPPSSISPPRVSGQMAVAPHVGAGIGAQTQQQQASGAMRRDPHSRKASAGCDRDHPYASTAGRVEGTRKVRGVRSLCRDPIAGTALLLLLLVSTIKGRMVFFHHFPSQRQKDSTSVCSLQLLAVAVASLSLAILFVGFIGRVFHI